jgi:Spy/CpxP family protein refolding chaperone
MSKLLTTLLAATFAAATVTPIAFAAKHEMGEKVAAACKGKKAGDMVKVDGKDTKCPEAAPAKK